TLSEKRIALPAQEKFTAKEGGQWRPFAAADAVRPGSALDFSNLLDAPAGKHGFVTEKDGHFYFENAPGERVRFHGTNLCYSANYPEKKDAPRIAEYLAGMGYNVVRFHHYDGLLTEGRKNSLDIDWKKFDRMEFFIAECEKRGMYVVIDLFSYRMIPDGEIPGIKGDMIAAFKALPPVSEAGFENWKAFAKAIMTHVNPYTGKALAEDPALVGLCPVNEDPLGTVWRENASVAAIYDGLFAEWKKARNIEPKGWTEEQAALSKFLNEIQIRAEAMYADYLKNTLKVKSPLTGANCLVAISLTEPRNQFDYVDNHIYWDHPEFPVQSWKLPYRYTQLSAIEAGVHVPRTLFPSRIAGRPFTVTEWNYCNPNRYRAEGAPLIAAYASLQDWDGLYRFAESHNIENLEKPLAGNGFDLATDPICQLTERVAGLMYLRGDIAPAKGMLTYAVDATNGYRVISGWSQEGYEEGIEYAGLVTGVASVWSEKLDPASIAGPVTGSERLSGRSDFIPADDRLVAELEKRGLVPANSFDPAKGVYTSDTGELVAGVKDGTFTIATPRGVWLVANHPGKLHAGTASASFESGPSSVAAVSLDGAPLATSRRIIVLHLTESLNAGQAFQGASMRMMDDWGKLPHLMRAGKATLAFASSVRLRAWALDLSGKRIREVKLTQKDGVLTINLDNTTGKSATLAYEIAEK
ncbi:MAG TPA: cellulase family glycosylhydrolase, partial [Opitutales bacterium]|nr:cellulase family glycosylhydrolase [Opitutales bacterium]